LLKSSHKKLPAPKQVTIIEDLSGKLAAAVSGQSDDDMPYPTGKDTDASVDVKLQGSQEDHKLHCKGQGTTKQVVQHEATVSQSSKTPRGGVFSFLCGTCVKPTADAD
jgi:hypothetical protein